MPLKVNVAVWSSEPEKKIKPILCKQGIIPSTEQQQLNSFSWLTRKIGSKKRGKNETSKIKNETYTNTYILMKKGEKIKTRIYVCMHVYIWIIVCVCWHVYISYQETAMTNVFILTGRHKTLQFTTPYIIWVYYTTCLQTYMKVKKKELWIVCNVMEFSQVLKILVSTYNMLHVLNSFWW